MFIIILWTVEKDSGSSIHQPTCLMFFQFCFAILGRSLSSETFMWRWKWGAVAMLVGAAPSHSSSPPGPLRVQKALIHLCLSPYEDKLKEVLWRGLGLDRGSGASSQSGSCCACGIAQLHCTNSQDRDHLENKYLRNGSLLSCDIHSVPHQSNETNLLMKLWVFWLSLQSGAEWAARPTVDFSLYSFRLCYMTASQISDFL